MLSSQIIQSYCDEKPDINRNPFKQTTRIDCDKIFRTVNVCYDEKLLTTSRRNICEELFEEIKNKLSYSQAACVQLDEKILVTLNALIIF
jgi:hypothetical protein